MNDTTISKQLGGLLAGINVLICRPEASAKELSTALSALGAHCCCFPTLAIAKSALSETDKQCILNLDQYNLVVVTSQHAARFGLEWVDQYWPQFPSDQTWLAIGQKTASLLANEPLSLLSPKQDHNSESLLKETILQKVKQQKILIMKGRDGRDTLQQVLSKRGASVDQLELYRRERPNVSGEDTRKALVEFQADYIVALSGETLLNLISLCEEHHIDLSSKTLIVPSHRVANIAYEQGFKSVLIPANLKPIDLIKCITKHKNT